MSCFKYISLLFCFICIAACGDTIINNPPPSPTPVASPTPTPGPNSVYIESPIVTGSWVTRVSVIAKDIGGEISKVSFYRDLAFITEVIQPDGNGAWNYDFNTYSIQCGVYSYLAKATLKSGLILTTNAEVMTLYPTSVITFPALTGAKTFVAFDTYADGTRIPSGRSGNGNLGHSAQTGADCCRPDADPKIMVGLPDFNPHRIDVYAYDSSGNPMNGNHAIATFAISKQVCKGI